MVVSTYGPNDFVPILVANRRAVVGDTPKRFFRHFGMKQTHSVPAVYGAIARPLAAITFARFYHAIMNIVVDGPDGQLESTVQKRIIRLHFLCHALQRHETHKQSDKDFLKRFFSMIDFLLQFIWQIFNAMMALHFQGIHTTNAIV